MHSWEDFGFGRKSVNMEGLSESLTISTTTERAAWKALAEHHQQVSKLHLRKLFADDPGRGERMTVEAAGIYLDYSKNRITDQTLNLLVQLAQESDLRGQIGAMFRGERINITEN